MTDLDSIIIDTPEGIAMYRLLAMRSALKIELRTGMKMSKGPSVMSIINREYGTKFRRKIQALEFIEDVIESTGHQLQTRGL